MTVSRSPSYRNHFLAPNLKPLNYSILNAQWVNDNAVIIDNCKLKIKAAGGGYL